MVKLFEKTVINTHVSKAFAPQGSGCYCSWQGEQLSPSNTDDCVHGMVWIEKDLNIYHLVPTPAVAGTPPSRPGCSRHATAVITGPTGLLFPKFIFSPLGYGMSVQGTAQENKTSCQEVGVCGIDQDVTPGAVLSLLKTLQHIPYHCSDSVLEQLGAPWSVVMSSPCTRGFGCCKSRAGPPVILTVAHT